MFGNQGSRRPRAAIVRSTGLAKVDKDEIVIPAAGTQAQAERVIEDSRNTIHYHFPVEIEVRFVQESVDPELVAQQVLHNVAALVENMA
jgi:hypothetical protein